MSDVFDTTSYENMLDGSEDAVSEVDSEHIRRYLAFVSDELTYAINAVHVTEIITNHAITILPMVPDYISGIINLRGQIIPIIDIRRRMGKYSLDNESDGAANCIVVLNIDSIDLGIMVDTVSQVLDIDESKIAPMPSSNHQDLVNGIFSLPNGDTILLFDCELLAANH